LKSPDPEALEELGVRETVAITAAVRRLGATRLLLAQLDWGRFTQSAVVSARGAAHPEVARASLTRRARKDAAARQRSRRALSDAGRARAMHKLLATA
jgi:hypothetical protein